MSVSLPVVMDGEESIDEGFEIQVSWSKDGNALLYFHNCNDDLNTFD